MLLLLLFSLSNWDCMSKYIYLFNYLCITRLTLRFRVYRNQSRVLSPQFFSSLWLTGGWHLENSHAAPKPPTYSYKSDFRTTYLMCLYFSLTLGCLEDQVRNRNWHSRFRTARLTSRPQPAPNPCYFSLCVCFGCTHRLTEWLRDLIRDARKNNIEG